MDKKKTIRAFRSARWLFLPVPSISEKKMLTSAVSRTAFTNLVEDQRENDRREREAPTLATLSGSEQESAVIVEAQRQANYNLLVCHVYRQS